MAQPQPYPPQQYPPPPQQQYPPPQQQQYPPPQQQQYPPPQQQQYPPPQQQQYPPPQQQPQPPPQPLYGHGACRVSPPTEESSPFARLLPSSPHVYNPVGLALLADALGPMQSRGRGHRSTKPRVPAGFTFVLQLLDHDMTEQVGSSLSLGQKQVVTPEGQPTSLNGHTGRLDLDSLYGKIGHMGVALPELFDNRGRFILGKIMRKNTNAPRDIERNVNFGDGRRIAEPRNDENKLIVQFHVLFARYHNFLIDRFGFNFVYAMQQTVLTWQRIVFADVLPRVVLPDVLSKVKLAYADGNTLFQAMNQRIQLALPNVQHGDNRPIVAMPVEFAHGVFRFGHSMLRNTYRLNKTHTFPLFTTFPVPTAKDCVLNVDLRGHVEITDDTEIDFNFFFGPYAHHAEPIDVKLPAAIFRLPHTVGIAGPPLSLPHRNIQRGIDFSLPSGQEACFSYSHVYGHFPRVKNLKIPKDVLDSDSSLGEFTPLFYYILREAEELTPNGTQLGPLGSLIVGETVLGCLAESGFKIGQEVPKHRHYTKIPTHQIQYDRIWTMVELLHFLGEF